MRKTTVRFTDELWELLEREAEAEGVSVAQLVRDAALFRIAYKSGVRDERQRPGQADGGERSRGTGASV